MAWDYQFVDSIAATPAVRLNLQTDWFVREDTSFAMPELRRSVVQSALVDGETYPSGAYGNRTVVLVLEHRNPGSSDAVSASLQALTRELNRPTNLLMYRPGTTQPVFFRTFRAGPSSVQWDASRKVATAEIPAEPFALGLRETLSVVTVSNDPAAGANGCFLDVASPKGDVEAPLYLRFRAVDVSRVPETPGSGRRQAAVAVRRGGTPSAMPALLQAEAMAAGTDTTAQAASGSSGTFLRTSFSTAATLQPRATTAGQFPASPGVDVRGTYRVFLRCRKSVSTDTMQMQLQYISGDSYITSDLAAGPAGTVWRWVDMGLVQMPLGYDPVTDGLSGTALPVGGMAVSLYAARTAGSGTLDLDALMFLPADDRLSFVKWPSSTTETAYVVDPVNNQVYGVGSAGEVRPALLELVGLPPLVTPGVTNRVWVLGDVGSTWSAGDLVTTTIQVTPYYWPRYVTVVRPVAS